jgi:hypothetical protein
MPKTLIVALALALCAAGSSQAFAKSCRDDHGKFIKCAPVMKMDNHCRDMKTKKFAKCGAPGSEHFH